MLFFFFSQTNIPIFKQKESSARRRYSDFEWVRTELERDSKVSIWYSIKFKICKLSILRNTVNAGGFLNQNLKPSALDLSTGVPD